MKAALDEPHIDDVICKCDGLNLALQKTLASGDAAISIDFSGTGFTAAVEK